MADDEILARLDEAIIRTRRLWSSPGSTPVDPTRWPGVELSTVLVAETLHRLRSAAPTTEATVVAVANRLDLAHSTVSRLVDRAARAGALRRMDSAQDARRTVLVLTERGQRLVNDAAAHRRGFLEVVLDGWPAEEVALLADLLTQFADALRSADHRRLKEEDHEGSRDRSHRGDRQAPDPHPAAARTRGDRAGP